MEYNKVPVLVKAGRFDGRLEEAVKRCIDPLREISLTLGNTVKYAHFDNSASPYFLQVTQRKDNLLTPSGYNVLLTVASDSDSRNQQVVSQFEKDTGIQLDVKVPDFLKRSAVFQGMAFEIFKRKPEAAMSFLMKGML